MKQPILLLSDFFLAANVVNVLCQWQTNTNLDSYGRKKQSRHILTQHLSCFGLFFLSLQNQEAFDCYGGNKDLLQGFFGGSWILSPNEKEVEILCLGNGILRVRGGKATDSMEACIQQVNCGVGRLHPLRHLNICPFLPNFALFTLYLVFLSFHQGRCQIWVFYVQGYPPLYGQDFCPKKVLYFSGTALFPLRPVLHEHFLKKIGQIGVFTPKMHLFWVTFRGYFSQFRNDQP